MVQRELSLNFKAVIFTVGKVTTLFKSPYAIKINNFFLKLILNKLCNVDLNVFMQTYLEKILYIL